MVNIFQPTDSEIYVNDKRVYLDQNGNWITTVELTISEEKAFQQHIQA